MQPETGARSWNVRAILESTGTPFVVAAFEPRQVVFRQGDPSDSVMYLARGRVLLAVTERSGKEAICGIVGTGAFLGEEALARHAVRRQSATAMTAAEVLAVPKAGMTQLLHTQPAIADRFIAHVLARNTRLEADLVDQLLHSGEERLAHTLLVLAGCGEQCPHRCALPPITQELIAEMVGTTRSRVNALMGKFKKLGFIEANSGVLLVNPARLHVVNAGDRVISNGGTPAIPQPFSSDGRYWPLAG